MKQKLKHKWCYICTCTNCYVLDMDENSPDDNEVWTPPESTQEPYPLGYDQPRGSSYQSNAVYSSSQLTFPSSSTQNVQSYSSQFIPQDFQPPDSARLTFLDHCKGRFLEICKKIFNLMQKHQTDYFSPRKTSQFDPKILQKLGKLFSAL